MSWRLLPCLELINRHLTPGPQSCALWRVSFELGLVSIFGRLNPRANLGGVVWILRHLLPHAEISGPTLFLRLSHLSSPKRRGKGHL